MGFTRYYNGNVTITPEFLQDVQTIITNSGINIKGWDGTGEPHIAQDEIRFNGDSNLSQAYETFALNNGDNYGFCKTAREPYDLIVATILKRAEALNPDFHADSDGGNNETDVETYYNKLFVNS